MCTRLIILFCSTFMLMLGCGDLYAANPEEKTSEEIELSILQLNLWVECTKVENAPQYLIEQIAYIHPDIATFCELYKGEQESSVLSLLVTELGKRGMHYYSARVDGRAIISKYPILAKEKINEWMFKAVLDIQGRRVAVYPSHSEYRYYSCYYPRGYNDGVANWDKLPAAITDVKTILSANRQSGRLESARSFIADAKKEIEKGALVFFAGDLNEPSHLDWQEDTKNLRDHNGCVVDWDVSLLLDANGFKDAYRVCYPDAVNYPGFTFPADNKGVDVAALTWAAEADERERIDFIYYYPTSQLSIRDAKIAGPSGSILRSQRVEEETKDLFIASDSTGWPTDHKGVLVTFLLKP